MIPRLVCDSNVCVRGWVVVVVGGEGAKCEHLPGEVSHLPGVGEEQEEDIPPRHERSESWWCLHKVAEYMRVLS